MVANKCGSDGTFELVQGALASEDHRLVVALSAYCLERIFVKYLY